MKLRRIVSAADKLRCEMIGHYGSSLDLSDQVQGLLAKLDSEMNEWAMGDARPFEPGGGGL